MNVVRVSGGNPTIAPEMILDLWQELKIASPKTYLWIDSNLSTSEYMAALGNEFKEMLRKKNVGVVGCFKGVNAEEFATITGAMSDSFAQQFETAEWLIEQGTDFYVYLPDLVYGGDVEGKLINFAQELMKIRKNLPLRAEMLAINDYQGALKNIERCAKLGRLMPATNQRIVLDAWYNKVLPRLYESSELNKFCCEVSLGE